MTDNCEWKGVFPPHEHMINKSVETTKIRIIYDALAKAEQVSASLNDCPGTGSPINHSHWDMLIQCLFSLMLLPGDI